MHTDLSIILSSIQRKIKVKSIKIWYHSIKNAIQSNKFLCLSLFSFMFRYLFDLNSIKTIAYILQALNFIISDTNKYNY